MAGNPVIAVEDLSLEGSPDRAQLMTDSEGNHYGGMWPSVGLKVLLWS